MIFLLISFLFTLGLLVGSFLNLVIDRIPKGEQIFKGKSHCDSCKHDLAWYDLIPIFSWFLLKGKCRYCHSPIPLRNVIVELVNGVLFVLIWLWVKDKCFDPFGCYIAILLYCYIAASLIVIFFIDLETYIIPDEIVYPAIGLTVFFHLLHLRGASLISDNLKGFLVAGFGAAAFFLALVLITRGRGMGGGDVKLAFSMGLLLGFPKILIALYFAFLTGALSGVILVLIGKKSFKSHIPFGPFLIAGTFLALFWGERLINIVNIFFSL